MNRFELKKLRSVTAIIYTSGSFDIPINFSYKALFDKIPKFEVAVDLRGRLHLISDQVVKNRTNYFEPLEVKWGGSK